MRARPIRITSRQALLFVVDVMLIVMSVFLSWGLRLLDIGLEQFFFLLDLRSGALFVTVVTHLLTFYVFELYNPAVDFRRAPGVARIIAAVALGSALLAIVFYSVPAWRLSRGMIAINVVVLGLFIVGWRAYGSWRWRQLGGSKPALVIGAGRMGKLIATAIQTHPDAGIQVVGFLDDDPEKHDTRVSGRPVLGDTSALREAVAEHGVQMVVIALRERKRPAFASDVLDLKSQAVQVVHAATLYKHLTGKVPILYVDDFYFLFGPDLDRMRNPWLRNLHRLFDIGLSSFGLLLASPLLLLGVLAVRLTSRGPVFYRQERVGLNKVPFTILKLRTMRVDAEASTGAVMSRPGRDPRVTPVGRWLRRSRIDELPQLFNVLKGDMSIIGPRPERPEFTRQFEREIPYYALRFAVKPGLTGWAQVNFKYGSDAADTAEKLQYDLFYIQEMSLVLDLHIVLKTFQTVLLRAGS